MKESYNRQANYPIGKPFTTDVMRDTLKNVERKSENNRYASLGNLMPSVAWPVTVMGEYSDGSGGTESDIFRVRINDAGTVDLLDLLGGQIKFYPTLTYPAALDDPSTHPGSEHGGTAIPTSFATYVAGTSPNRSSFTIYPRADIASFGDMYIKDVVFTVAHDGALAPGTITCIADSNSKELLPNNQYVYYSWTLTYATGVTVDDIHTYLTSGVPTLFAAYFYCSKKNEGVTATMPAATTKNLFFMTQGLTLGMDQIVTQRLLTGLEYLMTADLAFADYHELVVYIKMPYSTDTRDSVTYYSHMEKFPKSSYAALSTSNILFSWEMTTEECDMSSLIPFAYRENDGTLIFVDGTRFYKSKLNNGDFKPLSGTRTFELGGFAIFNADGALYDVNSSGAVGEMDLVNEDRAGYYNLINKLWWYATDDSYTFYRYDSGASRPAFAINRTSGQVIVGGGYDQVATADIQSPYNTHALTTLVPVGETLLTIYAPDGVAGLRSTLLYGQNGQTDYSAMVQLTQTDGTSDPGLYIVSHINKIFMGIHDGGDADMLVTGSGKPYMLMTTDSLTIHNGTSSINLWGPTGLLPDTVYLSTGGSAYALMDDTNGIILSYTDSTSAVLTVHDVETKITGAATLTLEAETPNKSVVQVTDSAIYMSSSDAPTGQYPVSTSYMSDTQSVVKTKVSTSGPTHPHGVSFIKTSADAGTLTGTAYIFGGQYTGTTLSLPTIGNGILISVSETTFAVGTATGISYPPAASIGGTVVDIFSVTDASMVYTYRGGATPHALTTTYKYAASTNEYIQVTSGTTGLCLRTENTTNIIDGAETNSAGYLGTDRVILTSYKYQVSGSTNHQWGAINISASEIKLGFGTDDFTGSVAEQWNGTGTKTTISNTGDITTLGTVEASGFGIKSGPSGATHSGALVFDQNGGGTITLEIYGGIITSITVVAP